MTQKPLPGDISRPERIEAAVPFGEEQPEIGTPSQSFSSLMQKPESGLASQAGKAQMVSPFDLAQGPRQNIGAPNLDTLLAQVQLAQSTMSDLQNQFSYPNLKLKSSQRYVMKNKLADANANIRAATAKMGVPLPNEEDAGSLPSKGTGPLAQFLNYVTDGMNQMESAKQQLNDLKNKGKNLTPADFLLIQIKLNKAQQELDFTSVLLSKAVEDFKMLMNIQL
jgi:hypothetical protein